MKIVRFSKLVIGFGLCLIPTFANASEGVRSSIDCAKAPLDSTITSLISSHSCQVSYSNVVLTRVGRAFTYVDSVVSTIDLTKANTLANGNIWCRNYDNSQAWIALRFSSSKFHEFVFNIQLTSDPSGGAKYTAWVSDTGPGMPSAELYYTQQTSGELSDLKYLNFSVAEIASGGGNKVTIKCE